MIKPRLFLSALSFAPLSFAILSFAILAHAADPAPAPLDPQASFASAQQMIDIGGRRMHLHCSGNGPVTVVFDSQSGEPGWSWNKVQPAVAKHTRACIYDRAGLGFSDPSPRPGTLSNAVDDLHQLLGKAGIAPPYLLVGNSYGGAAVQMFAWRYPATVKGLVLVDPHHEDELERTAAVTQGKWRELYAMGEQMEKACAEQAQRGFASGSDLFMNCTGGIRPEMNRRLAAAHLAIYLSPAYWTARQSENDHFIASEAELRAARRSFGDLPLLVLSRGVSPYAVPGKPPSALNKAAEAENLKMNTEVAALSTRGKVRVVPKAGHIIQFDQPAAVVDAVTEVLGQIRP